MGGQKIVIKDKGRFIQTFYRLRFLNISLIYLGIMYLFSVVGLVQRKKNMISEMRTRGEQCEPNQWNHFQIKKKRREQEMRRRQLVAEAIAQSQPQHNYHNYHK